MPIRPNAGLEQHERQLMTQAKYHLDKNSAKTSLTAILETAQHRKWTLLACHLDSTHVHMVVIAEQDPKRVMLDMKTYSSRALNRSGTDDSSRKRWTRGGSTQYLWNVDDVMKSVDYTLNRQGKPLASYRNPELTKILHALD